MNPHRRTAWHCYLIIVTELLPALRQADAAPFLSERFAALGERLTAGGRWWGADGARLAAIAARADAMHHCGDHTAAAVLLRALALRLFSISSSTPTSSRGGCDPD